MLTPNLDIGRRFVDMHAPTGRMLLCALTGSHHYGFPSKDSDLDLKGIHLAPTSTLLGLTEPVETRDRLAVSEGVECDFTSHEAKKALKLLMNGNGNILERILSPFQLLETPELPQLQQLANDAISKRFFGHYRGYFRGVRNEHEKYPKAKSLLYCYRVALTGIHLLKTGELEANLCRTGPEYGFADIRQLVDYKRDEGEKSTLPESLNRHYSSRLDILEEMLNDAHNTCGLAAEPENYNAVSDWLTQLRQRDGTIKKTEILGHLK